MDLFLTLLSCTPFEPLYSHCPAHIGRQSVLRLCQTYDARILLTVVGTTDSRQSIGTNGRLRERMNHYTLAALSLVFLQIEWFRTIYWICLHLHWNPLPWWSDLSLMDDPRTFVLIHFWLLFRRECKMNEQVLVMNLSKTLSKDSGRESRTQRIIWVDRFAKAEHGIQE